MDAQHAIANMKAAIPEAPSVDGMCRVCGRACPGSGICERCYEAKLRRERVRDLARRLSAEGLYGRASQAVSFRNSDASIEARNPDAWKAMRAYRGKKNLFIAGAVGSGKTHGARCVLTRAMNSEWLVGELSALELFRLHRDFDRERFDRFVDVRALLVDDIDKTAQWTAARIECLWEVLNERGESNGRRTIITANSTPKRLRETLIEQTGNEALVGATLDRLVPLEVVELRGESNRGRIDVTPCDAG